MIQSICIMRLYNSWLIKVGHFIQVWTFLITEKRQGTLLPVTYFLKIWRKDLVQWCYQSKYSTFSLHLTVGASSSVVLWILNNWKTNIAKLMFVCLNTLLLYYRIRVNYLSPSIHYHAYLSWNNAAFHCTPTQKNTPTTQSGWSAMKQGSRSETQMTSQQ